MAVFNRILDFFNGGMGPAERPRFQPPMNAQPYVDDIFDPLFNRDVVEYNRNLYGTLGAIPAGFAQMWENALAGRQGILGPGMGILSTFGRSMDKADDFILGGLTEGVNAIGRFTGTNDAPTNPIRNIFVEDQDYEGSDLLAAMGNAMGKLAGGVRLDRGDFSNLPDRLQSSVVNLATDPGFAGGHIARENPANRMAAALDAYDDVMAKAAGNLAVPGLQTAARSALDRLNLALGTVNAKALEDVVTSGGKKTSDDLASTVEKMDDDLIKAGGINVSEDPELAKTMREVRQKTRRKFGKQIKAEAEAQREYAFRHGLIEEQEKALEDVSKATQETSDENLRAFSGLLESEKLRPYDPNATITEPKTDVTLKDIGHEASSAEEAYARIRSEIEDQLASEYRSQGYSEDEIAEQVRFDFEQMERDDPTLREIWGNVMSETKRVHDIDPNTPVFIRPSAAGYQRRVMPKINKALALADAKLYHYSEYARAGEAVDAVRPKSYAERLKQTLTGLETYLYGEKLEDYVSKKGKPRRGLPYALQGIEKEIDKVVSDIDAGKADAYSIMQAQRKIADIILSEEVVRKNYFNDQEGLAFSVWAQDVKNVMDRTSPRVWEDPNVSIDAISYDDALGGKRNPTLFDDYSYDDESAPPLFLRDDPNRMSSIEYSLNSAFSVKPEDMRTVKQWVEFEKMFPDTMDIELKKGRVLTAPLSYMSSKKVPEDAKMMARFATFDRSQTMVKLKSHGKIEDVAIPTFRVKKSMFERPEFQDNAFLSNFILLDRNTAREYNGRWYANEGEYVRLSRKNGGLYKKLDDVLETVGGRKVQSEYVRLGYLPHGDKNYLAGISYDPNSKTFTISNQDALDLFSTRKLTAPVLEKRIRDEFLLKPMGRLSDIRKPIEEKYAKITIDAEPELVGNIFKDIPSETIAKFVADPGSLNTMTEDEMEQTFLSSFLERFKIPENAPHEEIAKAIDDLGSPDEKRLFALIQKASAIDANLKRKSPNVGIRASKEAKAAIDEARRLKEATSTPDGKYDGTLFKKAQRFRWSHEDQIIPGASFIDYIRHTPSGVFRVGLTGENAVRYDAIKKVLTRNVDAVNASSKHGNLLRLKEFENDGSKFIEVGLDYMNPEVKKAGKTYLGGLFPKSLPLEDVVIQRASTLPESDDIKPYINLFDQIEDVMRPIYVRMGGAAPQADWMMHVVSDEAVGRKVFTDINAVSGTDLAKSKDALNSLGKIVGAPSVRGKLGTPDYRRAYLGDYAAYEGGFTDDPVALAEHSFSDGVANSVYANSVQEFFYNPQLRIKEWFDSPERLAEAFRVRDAQGNRAGNLSGLLLATPTIDENGVLTGIRRYDVLSDADIRRAFEDENAVVLPNSAIVSLERLLRKDKRLMYQPTLLGRLANYVHHYVSVPIKFGVLSNMGFLAGNVQDAYFKQAETMAKAYGTTIDEELANVGMAYRITMDLNNDFSDVYDMYLSALKDEDAINAMTGSAAETNRLFGNTLSVVKKADKLGTKIDPAEIMNNPRYFKEWLDFVNHPKNVWYKPGSKELNVARVYTFLQVRQNTATFENNTLDLADVYDAERLNPYDVPENVVDRVMYGNPSSEIFTYGLMLNNPFSNWILRKSNGFESFTRSASIVNSMIHQGWSLDKIADILGKNADEYASIREKLRVDSYNAVNLMHHSNFDYENVTDFMDAAGKVMPFPTFYIKNISHWADTFSEHPEMLDDVISFHEGLWQSKDVKDDEFAAEAKGRGAYPLGGRTKLGTGIVKQSPVNSMFSAFSALNNFKEDIAYRVHPLARPLTRHLQDPEDVKYRPYSTNPYEKNVKMGDPKFSNLAYMFHQLNPYERFTNTYLRTPKKVASNEYQSSDFLPSVFQPDFGKKPKR